MAMPDIDTHIQPTAIEDNKEEKFIKLKRVCTNVTL